MSRLEKDIQRKIKDYAQSLAVVVRKLNIDGEIGWPDLICMYRGVTWYIEVKRLGEQTRRSQIRIHQLIKKTGHDVFVVDTVSDGKLVVDIQKNHIDLTHAKSNEGELNDKCDQ